MHLNIEHHNLTYPTLNVLRRLILAYSWQNPLTQSIHCRVSVVYSSVLMANWGLQLAASVRPHERDLPNVASQEKDQNLKVKLHILLKASGFHTIRKLKNRKWNKTIVSWRTSHRAPKRENPADSALRFGVMGTKWSGSPSQDSYYLASGFIPKRDSRNETCWRE